MSRLSRVSHAPPLNRAGRSPLPVLGLLFSLAMGQALLSPPRGLAADFSSWSQRMPITFTGYDKSEPLTNFPVLVKLGTNLTGFSYADFTSPSNGADLRFAASNETDELNYEIESWNTNGTSFVWVQVPTLASPGDFICAYWGNGSAALPAYTTNGATWSEGYIAVYHLGETATPIGDSTSNRLSGTLSGNSLAATGTANGARLFDGDGDRVNVPNHSLLDPTRVTVEAWARQDSRPVAYPMIVSRGYTGSAVPYHLGYEIGGISTKMYFGAYNGSWQIAASPQDPVVGTLYYWAGSFDGSYFRLYSNGTHAAALGWTGNLPAGTRQLTIGDGDWNGALGTYEFSGMIDEVRISSYARSSNWIWACWASQSSNSSFLTCGPAEPAVTQLTVNALSPIGVGTTNATTRGKVMHTGEAENPAVYVCWGYGDGDTNATSSWAHADYVGTNWGKGQSFSWPLTGLISGSSYVYRCYATNTTGEAWSSTQTFTTVYLPTVANLGAVEGRLASWLRGQVTDSGGGLQPPQTWFLYWQSGNAATTAVAMGEQGGVFSNALGDVTPSVTYEYLVMASNAAGTVSSTVSNFASLATGWYVTTNGDDLAAGTNWATAFLTPSNAIAHAIDGDMVTVSNGAYLIAGALTITNDITLISANGPTTTTLRANGAVQIFILSNANAAVDGFLLTGSSGLNYTYHGAVKVHAGTLRSSIIANNSVGGGGGVHLLGGLVAGCTIVSNAGVWTSNGEGGGAYITGGTLSNCCLFSNWGDDGGGIFMTAGTVDRCIVSNNAVVTYFTGAQGGGGVTLRGGTLKNSLVVRNRITNVNAMRGGGINMTGGSIVNCTIADNRCAGGYAGAGLYMTAGTVMNSILYYNSSFFPAIAQENVYATGGSITYSCTQPLTNNTGNTALSPDFLDRGGNDYHLGFGSAGLETAAASAPAVDLDGNGRPLDGDGDGTALPDMGCYEADTLSAFRCSFRGEPVTALLSLEAVLTAEVAGPGTDTVTYAWDFENDGTNDLVGTSYAVVTNIYGVGFHSVRLTCTNSLGTTASLLRTDYLKVDSDVAYVSTNGGNVAPYETWAKAATNIQTALNTVYSPGTVTVSNGTYTIGQVLDMSRGVTLVSANGPSNTTLRAGAGTQIVNMNHTNAAVDGFLLTGCSLNYAYHGAAKVQAGTLRNSIIAGNVIGGGGGVHLLGGLVTDCTISNNNSYWDSNGDGGGAYITGGVFSNCTVTGNIGENGAGIFMTAGTVTRCTITNNVLDPYGASQGGAGVRMTGGSLVNCLVTRNRIGTVTSINGGGVYMTGGSIIHCTIADNRCAAGYAGAGLVMTMGAVTNSIVYHNSAFFPAVGQENVQATGGSIVYSCTQPLTNNTGNTDLSPDFVNRTNNNYRLLFGSAALDTGTNLDTVAADLAGSIRPSDGDGNGSALPDMGCYETDALSAFSCTFRATPLTGLLSLQAVFTAEVAGPGTDTVTYAWDFENDGFDNLIGTQYAVVTNVYGVGRHSVRLTCSNSLGTVTSLTRTDYLTVYPDVVYVSTNGAHIAPYETWANAATNIQAALDAVPSAGTVYVSNGTYTISQALDISRNLALISVNGFSNTTLRANGAVQIFIMNHAAAVVDGFLLTGSSGLSYLYHGAVKVQAGTLRNSVIANNSVGSGGGVHLINGLVEGCTITNNVASWSNNGDGGGAYVTGGTLSNCCLFANRGENGGGIFMTGGVVDRCTVSNNWINPYSPAAQGGGGVRMGGGTMRNTLVTRNRSTHVSGTNGAGIFMTGGSIVNCTVTHNRCAAVDTGAGITMTAGGVTNSILYYNGTNVPATAGQNVNKTGGTIAFSDTEPLVTGENNIDTAPLFVNTNMCNYRLAMGSPCLDVGTELAWMIGGMDLDGNLRAQGPGVDLGAYERRGIAGTVFVVH